MICVNVYVYSATVCWCDGVAENGTLPRGLKLIYFSFNITYYLNKFECEFHKFSNDAHKK